ncbi:hypothetical protein ETD83_33865 [Actinomadura soli]|uniref:WD40 repeat domain-containing protein n=1 Tax=Actinomadura soli TaxID=2508997 RepID=A0A5C4J229_9ACTN|nr:hypothetical protein [Actinomadura soli]TMQ90796.1 hypothetical protein ETD83_33865 [Actinomadura soli]
MSLSRVARTGAALVLAGSSTCVLAPAAAAGAARADQVAFMINDSRITESSGLAASARHPGIVYTHNDSGGVPKIYALDAGGRVRAVLTLAGAGARDWEGIALGKDGHGRPAIFVADIGDNLGGAWPYVTVYRIREPSRLGSRTLPATAFKIKYPDGPRNAETFMINPRTNRLFIASKLFGGKVYEAPAKLRTSGYNVLQKVANAPAMATDGAFSPDGRTCVIRSYFGARLYSVGPDGRPGKSMTSIDIPLQSQGESLSYTADGRSLLVGSEGENQPVYRLPLPDEALPSPSGGKAKNAGSAGDVEGHTRDTRNTRMGLFFALAIAAAVGYGLLRRRGGSSGGG